MPSLSQGTRCQTICPRMSEPRYTEEKRDSQRLAVPVLHASKPNGEAQPTSCGEVCFGAQTPIREQVKVRSALCGQGAHFSSLMRNWRKRTSNGSFVLTAWTCRPMKPDGVTPSFTSAAGTPFNQVLIESPLHSIRNWFQSFCWNALRAGSLFFKSLSQPRRPSS